MVFHFCDFCNAKTIANKDSRRDLVVQLLRKEMNQEIGTDGSYQSLLIFSISDQ